MNEPYDIEAEACRIDAERPWEHCKRVCHEWQYCAHPFPCDAAEQDDYIEGLSP